MNEIPVDSPNFSDRYGTAISAIVLHTTEGRLEGAIHWFKNPQSRVSAHVIIDRVGHIWRCVPDEKKAWHAGDSILHGTSNVNTFSLGVELERMPNEIGFPEMQLESCALWCAEKTVEYSIPLNRIVGHYQIAPNRKTDPRGFPWFPFLLHVSQEVLKIRDV